MPNPRKRNDLAARTAGYARRPRPTTTKGVTPKAPAQNGTAVRTGALNRPDPRGRNASRARARGRRQDPPRRETDAGHQRAEQTLPAGSCRTHHPQEREAEKTHKSARAHTAQNSGKQSRPRGALGRQRKRERHTDMAHKSAKKDSSRMAFFLVRFFFCQPQEVARHVSWKTFRMAFFPDMKLRMACSIDGKFRMAFFWFKLPRRKNSHVIFSGVLFPPLFWEARGPGLGPGPSGPKARDPGPGPGA